MVDLTVEDLQNMMGKLTIARLQTENETAEHLNRVAKAQADLALLKVELEARPSGMYGPLLTFYDDISGQWGVSYGAVGDQLIAMLPAHITETGVTAYGSSPEKAHLQFDKLWRGEA